MRWNDSDGKEEHDVGTGSEFREALCGTENLAVSSWDALLSVLSRVALKEEKFCVRDKRSEGRYIKHAARFGVAIFFSGYFFKWRGSVTAAAGRGGAESPLFLVMPTQILCGHTTFFLSHAGTLTFTPGGGERAYRGRWK